jgi:hypothetical protein
MRIIFGIKKSPPSTESGERQIVVYSLFRYIYVFIPSALLKLRSLISANLLASTLLVRPKLVPSKTTTIPSIGDRCCGDKRDELVEMDKQGFISVRFEFLRFR